MNIRPRHLRPLVALLALVAAAACGSAGSRSASAGTGAGATRASARRPVALAYGSTRPDTATPPEYYDMTNFDWYRRDQPLVADDLHYSPSGPPLPVARDSLRLAGRYQGVDYYESRHGGTDTLFVPVYGRYWLAFVRRGAGRSR